jgi:hypothetical protein
MNWGFDQSFQLMGAEEGDVDGTGSGSIGGNIGFSFGPFV